MSDLTKKEFQSILKAELKDRPTTEEVKNIVRSEIKKELLAYPNRDEVRQILREELQNYVTKDDLKNFATKDDLKKFATKEDFKKLQEEMKQMGLTIIDAIENMTSDKADKKQVDDLEQRMERVETKLSLT